MKKAFAALLVSFVFVFAFAGTALAADGPTITVSDKDATAGEEVTLDVTIADNPGLTNADITVKYDADAMSLKNAQRGAVLESGTGDVNTENGAISWITSGDAISTNGVLCTYTFSVLQGAVNGAHDVSVEVAYGTEDVDEAIASGTGKVTVSGGVEPATTAFSVYTQVGDDGEKVLAKEFAGAELEALADDSQQAQQWAKGIAVTDRWVSLEALFEAAGVADKWAAGSRLDYEHKGNPDLSYGAVTAAATLYSDAASDSDGGSGSLVNAVTPALALNYYKAGQWSDTVATVEQAIAASLAGADSGYTMFWGSSKDRGGNVAFNGIDEVTIVYPLTDSIKLTLGASELAATYGYEAGAVTASVTADASDDVKANPITYQWYSNSTASNQGGTPVSGATDASYAADGLNAGTWYYYVVASGTGKSGALSVASDVVTVTIGKAESAIAWSDGVTETTSSNSIVLSGDLASVTGSDAGVKYAATTSSEAPAVDSGAWQDSASFTGLSADTAYNLFAMVQENANYASAVSAAKVVSTKAAGAVENPTLGAVTYNPNATLADIALPEGWAWDDASAVPDVKTGTYAATFTPGDTDIVDYADVEGWDAESGTVTRDVALTVNKADPVISEAPTASAITYGQTLADSALAGGTASTGGAFAWAAPATAPSVAESGSAFAVTFTPTDTDNYNSAATTAIVVVNAKDASAAVVSGIEKAYDYTGNAIAPSPVVTLDDVILVAGDDYTVSYADNVAAGDASYTITFKGNYQGDAIEGSFFIKPVLDGEVVIDEALGSSVKADDAQLDSVLNEAIERYSFDKDKGVIVKLEVDKADLSDSQTKADVALIEEAAAKLGADYQVGEVYDVTLTAYHGIDSTDIGDTNTSTVSVVYTYDFSGKKNVVVFRVHDGEVVQLTETPNENGEYVSIDPSTGTITIVASKYSTYAIAYEPADEPNEMTPTTRPAGTSSLAKTGDALPPFAFAACGFIAALACAALFAAWRIRRNEMR